MYENYKLLASFLARRGLSLIAAKTGLSFLTGPIGSIIIYFVTPFFTENLLDGGIQIDKFVIKRKMGKSGERYEKVINEIAAYDNKKEKVPKEVKERLIAEWKAATKDFISARKYLRKS